MAESRRNLFPWFIMGGGVLLLLAGLVSVLLNRQPEPVHTATPASVEQVQRVSLEDAKAAFDGGTAVFLDVRASSSYEASHIPGAVSIPSNELSTRMRELDRGSWIIPY
jgi:3-mercaptopyruvate sulfurtransferase SseA